MLCILFCFFEQHQFGGKQFFTFESIALVPIQLKLIEKSLLTGDEVSVLIVYSFYNQTLLLAYHSKQETCLGFCFFLYILLSQSLESTEDCD